MVVSLPIPSAPTPWSDVATDKPNVTILSPHFDDVPLSLGQSLRSGVLAGCTVKVRVVFGRSNWTVWMHPNQQRATAVSWWRRAEEELAARSFGYRYSYAGWEESILRTGEMDQAAVLDTSAGLDDPLVEDVAGWLDEVLLADRPALLIAPAGLGGHVDHRIVATAAARLVAAPHPLAAPHPVAPSSTPIAFYEDRPYVAHLDADELVAQLPMPVETLEPITVSGPITLATQRRIRRCYPSQMTPYFAEAMAKDLDGGECERVWSPVGTAPGWLA